MSVRSASAEWKGNLTKGTGAVSSESGVLNQAGYTFASRFESGVGTNPEELLAAAHAGCYAMALSHELDQAGHTPKSVAAEARVHLGDTDDGPGITHIELSCRAEVPDIDEDTFQSIAEGAKTGCPISRALASVEITLDAELVS
ncbi:MAG: OsmC family peroxiredoxin [Gemmatimonadales bacterium]|nr:MAG: OsmC family peroxiredoxin [Gemmatimonadales bacterium]